MLGPFFINQPIVFDVVKFLTPGVAWDFFVNGKGISLNCTMLINNDCILICCLDSGPMTSAAVEGHLFFQEGISYGFLPFAVTSDIGSWFLKISGMKFNEVGRRDWFRFVVYEIFKCRMLKSNFKYPSVTLRFFYGKENSAQF
jgi:hypothetical protein